MNERPKVQSVDEYLDLFTGSARAALTQVRAAIGEVSPELQETISYAIPTYKLNDRPVLYFAGYPRHIGLYFAPTAGVFAVFAAELAPYKSSKSGIQIPLDRPMPIELIKKIVAHKLHENRS